MNESPIFEALMAEFVENSKYCRLRIGPLAGPAFAVHNEVKVGFEIVNGVTRIIEMGPEVGEGFEVVDGITRMIETEVVEVKTESKLYVVMGAPELIDLDQIVDEETEMEKTVFIPVITDKTPKPPSLQTVQPPRMQMLNDTQVMPIVRDIKKPEKPTNAPTSDEVHVTAIKHKNRPHKRNGATGTLGWFINRAA